VSIGAARERSLVTSLVRAGARLGVAGIFLLTANDALQNAVAEGDTAALSFHHLHTGENITVTFKRDGRYDEGALKKLNWFMRDWRKEKETRMDPHLFDLLWQVYREVGATEPIDVVCGYRSPGTNSMLRARSNGVARFSQHINGQAIDFYIPGVPLAKLRAAGLRLQRGGVGFYPTSGSPFVHMDTGNIRHWPRIPREELARIFPDGRTVHIPSDGRPLRNYALALADVERHGDLPSGTSLEAARESGVITASAEHEAEHPRHKPNLLARILGKGKDADKQSEGRAHPPSHAPLAIASLDPPKPPAADPNVPLPMARPVVVAAVAPVAQPVVVASVMPKPRPATPTYVTASLPGNIFDKRVVWQGAFESDRAQAAERQTPFEVASADPASTGSTGTSPLAYASDSAKPVAARARPMGSKLPRMPAEAKVMPASYTPRTAKQPLTPAMALGGQSSASPWLRAAMLTPSLRGFMTASRFGKIDLSWQHDLLDKPPLAVAMRFSTDPHLGMVADRFSGRAVVFLATTTFTRPVEQVAAIDKPSVSRRAHHHPKPGPIRQALSVIEGLLAQARAH